MKCFARPTACFAQLLYDRLPSFSVVCKALQEGLPAQALLTCGDADTLADSVQGSSVSVADDGTTLVFQDGVDIQPNMLAAWITANEVRSVNKSGINLDGVAWLRAEEAVFGNEWNNCKWTAFGNANN